MKARLVRWMDVAAGRVRDAIERRELSRWANAPFGATPKEQPEAYRRLWDEARAKKYPDVDAFEQACGAAIDSEWLDRLALTTQVTIKASDICYQHGRVLYAAVTRYVRTQGGRQLNVLETGTARGFSSVCLARAMQDSGATGKILTFDVLPHDVPMLWNCLLDVDGPRTRAQLLADWSDLVDTFIVFERGDTRRTLAGLAAPRVHIAFLDAVHEYEYVMAEYAAVRGRQRPGDLLLFDDYTPSRYPGVVAAADEICRVDGYRTTIVRAHEHRGYLVAEKQ